MATFNTLISLEMIGAERRRTIVPHRRLRGSATRSRVHVQALAVAGRRRQDLGMGFWAQTLGIFETVLVQCLSDFRRTTWVTRRFVQNRTLSRPERRSLSYNCYDNGGYGEENHIAFDPIVVRRRGRPPKPSGPTPQVEAQRAYRARLAAAGKVVRVIDAVPVDPAVPPATLAPVQDFDPATQMICDRAMFIRTREELRHALLKLELRDQEVQRHEQRNVYLEGEPGLQAQHHTNRVKELIVLRQQLAKRPTRDGPTKRACEQIV